MSDIALKPGAVVDRYFYAPRWGFNGVVVFFVGFLEWLLGVVRGVQKVVVCWGRWVLRGWGKSDG